MSTWREMYSAVERTNREVAALFMDLDGLLEPHGLKVATGRANTLGMQGGASLDKPSFWVPSWMSRHYGRDGGGPRGEDARWYVAVLLHARLRDDLQPLDEPVITGGVLADPGWDYWVAKAWGWGGDRPTDGSVVSRRITTGGLNTTIRCFAVPISCVRSPDDLVARVVDPLIAIEKPPPIT